MNVYLLNLGRMPYEQALALQHQCVAACKAGALDGVFILLEHPPVITLGRQAKEANILAAPAFLQQLGIQVHRVERGGDVTYHGPGQLIGYPILDLRKFRKDVGWFMRSLQQVLVDTLATYWIEAEARLGRDTGIWVGQDKIAAIGVRIERWVTYHGFALYVDPIMAHFDLIVPCGLHDKGVTSMREILGQSITVSAVRPVVVEAFERVYGVTVEEVAVTQLPGVSPDTILPSVPLARGEAHSSPSWREVGRGAQGPL